MKKLLFIPLLFFASCSPPNLTYHEWHTKEREYDLRDSVYVPQVECSDILKVKIGQSFEEVYKLTRNIPVKNYFHPGIALLRANCNNRDYEVALKYNQHTQAGSKNAKKPVTRDSNKIVQGISFKPQTSILYK